MFKSLPGNPPGYRSEVDVVRGDIILLETGDVVPADLRLITAADLRLGPWMVSFYGKTIGKP